MFNGRASKLLYRSFLHGNLNKQYKENNKKYKEKMIKEEESLDLYVHKKNLFQKRHSSKSLN